MNCPRCHSEHVTTKDRAYIRAYLLCLKCNFRWRLVRGNVQEVHA